MNDDTTTDDIPQHRRWWQRPLRFVLWLAAGAVLLPVLLVLLLRWLPPPTSAFMLARHIERWRTQPAAATPLRYQWVPWARISPQMPLAVIAAEDQNFFDHHGFDLEAIGEALERNAQGGRLHGGSTLSQQVAKNLFLWSGRSYLRKGLEVGFTLLIETLWPKQRILEVYVNIAEFAPDIYGVDAAARRLLDTTPARLNRQQAALLAAVLPSPRRLHADRPSLYLVKRTFWIAEQMEQLGGTAWIHQP